MNETQRALLNNSRQAAQAAHQQALALEQAKRAEQERLTKLYESLQIPPYTKLDNRGDVLDVDSERWQCAKSTLTGLIWEVKTNDGGLRDGQFTYSWMESISGDHTPLSGRVDGGQCLYTNCDTHAYIETINEIGLCGQSNWRLPTTSELESLVLLRNYIPKIDSRYFPHAKSFYYWSDTVYANYYDPDKYAHFPGVQAFQYWSEILSVNDYSLMTSVNFMNGLAYGARKSRNYHIRLVSDG
ncbi:MAG: DUF1566 domain-containing protein [Pseudomonadota bacterium]